jgi:CRP/FNR family transcriptional regulator
MKSRNGDGDNRVSGVSAMADTAGSVRTICADGKPARAYGAGEVIFNQGDDCVGFHYIQSGLIGLRRYDEDGHSTLIRLCSDGEAVGYRAAFAGEEHRVTAEVLMPSLVCFIERSMLLDALAKDASICQRFLRMVLMDMSDLEDRYISAVTQDARTRVLQVLEALCQRFGHGVSGRGHVLELPVSRQDLAALIGITPETLSRMIRRLQADNIADFHGRTVWFPDIGTLARAARTLH